VLSGGRLEFGVGRGSIPSQFHGFRVPVAENRARFDEALEIIRLAWTKERFSHRGAFWDVEDVSVVPKPLQRPHPPICIGGQGERRTLRSVARFAQHWNYPGGPVEQFAAKLDVLRAHCADLGRDPSEITVSTHLRGSAGDVVEQAKRYADAGLDLGIVYLQPPHTPDVLGELSDALAPLAS
jgi:alkanesulfonate monooxygenase SsuD/methylene tetrahydromethanopterin reductase-like flavin-dependent oxidoreductase (luciferase family)